MLFKWKKPEIPDEKTIAARMESTTDLVARGYLIQDVSVIRKVLCRAYGLDDFTGEPLPSAGQKSSSVSASGCPADSPMRPHVRYIHARSDSSRSAFHKQTVPRQILRRKRTGQRHKGKKRENRASHRMDERQIE